MNWPLRVTEERVGDVLVLSLRGRIAAGDAGALEGRVDAALTAGSRRLVIDLAAVDYVSSRGVQVLDTAHSRLSRAEGSLVLCGLTDSVRIVLELTKSAERLEIEPTRAAAVARASRAPDRRGPTGLESA